MDSLLEKKPSSVRSEQRSILTTRFREFKFPALLPFYSGQTKSGGKFEFPEFCISYILCSLGESLCLDFRSRFWPGILAIDGDSVLLGLTYIC